MKIPPIIAILSILLAILTNLSAQEMAPGKIKVFQVKGDVQYFDHDTGDHGVLKRGMALASLQGGEVYPGHLSQNIVAQDAFVMAGVWRENDERVWDGEMKREKLRCLVPGLVFAASWCFFGDCEAI